MISSLLVFCLHPGAGSFNHALADALALGAGAADHQTRRLDLSALMFNPDMGQSGFHDVPVLEPDLETAMAAINEASHVVFTAPMWWGRLPAKTKGFFDRAFLPGRAFDPRIRRRGMSKPLPAGRTARLILTSDTPGLFFRLMYGQAMRKQMERQILSFCGLAPRGFTHFPAVEHSTPQIRAQCLDRARTIGAVGADWVIPPPARTPRSRLWTHAG